jgi:hypothetical protein
MTGCPYSLIYSSAHTFDRLRREGRIDYHDGLLAFELGQDGEEPYALARELSTGTVHRFDADRVFVAGGAFGTTRLVLGSLRLFDETIEMAESVQFVMPMASVRPTPDPRASAEFTLNQFNMAIATDEEWRGRRPDPLLSLQPRHAGWAAGGPAARAGGTDRCPGAPAHHSRSRLPPLVGVPVGAGDGPRPLGPPACSPVSS